MPKTGERRKTHRPFAIDKLPPEWRERIIALRARWTPWERIEEESAQWEWEKLTPSQRQLYPKRRIAMRTLHRWYDVQVDQKLREMHSERSASLAIAAQFGAGGYKKLDESVQNAIADVVFSHPKGSADPESFRKRLLDLGWLLARIRQLDIAKEKVEVEKMKVEDIIARGNRATLEAAQKLGGTGYKMTLDDINRIRERTFGLPPIQRKEADPALLQAKLDELYGLDRPKPGDIREPPSGRS
jgi:hypothetical protein